MDWYLNKYKSVCMYKTALCFDFPEVDMEGLKKQVSKCNISMHFLLYLFREPEDRVLFLLAKKCWRSTTVSSSYFSRFVEQLAFGRFKNFQKAILTYYKGTRICFMNLKGKNWHMHTLQAEIDIKKDWYW